MIGLLIAAAAAAAAVTAPAHEPAAVFGRICLSCHGPNGWGTRALSRRLPRDQALLANRRDLSPELLHAVLRHGIGSMPSFTPTDLSDAEIDALAQWLASPHPADAPH